ncbi:hypothetical protein CWE22_04670 [Pseudidiomarina aestuarii]|uniref:Uncharacterized protein n=1 Tax=Pseudidiomarina aestuarii TaxID=624146 RepID=A0A7Z6ZUF3_9GAMM|nr:hypothetical protein [Pseudidiomarina aestuarii]RUO41462.1 hypothetical protein CWE22_04670 [Pseudidiomarina aestuarii]
MTPAVKESRAHCWRQCCTSKGRVVALLRSAQQWQFTHYSVVPSGSYYWLSCAQVGAHQRVYDYAHELRLQYPQLPHVIAVTEYSQQIHVVIWYQHKLVVSLSVKQQQTDVAWMKERLREWTESWELSDAHVLLDVPSDPSLNDFVRDYACSSQWLNKPAGKQTATNALLRPFSEPLPWQRRRRLWFSFAVVVSIAAGTSWWFWPERQVSAPRIQSYLYEIEGVPLSHLEQLLTYQDQANLIAGWQFQEATLAAGTWTIVMRSTYGSVSELRQQTPLVVSGDATSARLGTRFEHKVTMTPQQLVSDQQHANDALEALLNDWAEHIQWQRVGAPAVDKLQWQEYQLEWLPDAAGLDRKFAQALQALPGRLLEYRWFEARQELTMRLRFYWLPRHLQEADL